jgi:orotidine-5'-phosphate decarboxylase
MGQDCYHLLRATIDLVAGRSVMTIGDGKRGDIGTSAERYARALFEVLGFDAATVNPYQGYDSVKPYLTDPSRGAFVLCKTSNPGSDDFQDLAVDYDGSRMPLFEAVVRRALDWNVAGNVGLVVGATYPSQLGGVRALAPDVPILIPGVGAQGGDAAESVRLGASADGTLAVVSASRQVLYASSGPDWQAAARREAMALRDAMRDAVAV